MQWCLYVVWSVYILNNTKSDIGSTVDLVDAIILWHDGLYGKKKKNPVEKQSGVQWFVFVSSMCCVTVFSIDWGSSLVM